MVDVPEGRLDTTTLELLARRALTHDVVADWEYRPSHRSPRRCTLVLDESAFPADVDVARLDVRWFDTDDYSIHYLETTEDEPMQYQCRWDRHPKTDAPRAHFHPPPDAGAAIPSSLTSNHPLDVVFTILDWVGERIATLHE